MTTIFVHRTITRGRFSTIPCWDSRRFSTILDDDSRRFSTTILDDSRILGFYRGFKGFLRGFPTTILEASPPAVFRRTLDDSREAGRFSNRGAVEKNDFLKKFISIYFGYLFQFQNVTTNSFLGSL